jgi:hypothetical protein
VSVLVLRLLEFLSVLEFWSVCESFVSPMSDASSLIVESSSRPYIKSATLVDSNDLYIENKLFC